MKKSLLIILVLTISMRLNAQTFVDQGAIGANNGTTWANAYNDLANAIYNSGNDDTIWVKEGIYYPTFDTTGAVPVNPAHRSFWLKNGVVVYGGFAGNETNLSQRDPINHKAVLNGEMTASDVSEHVLFIYSNIDSTAVMDGFIVMNGNASSLAAAPHGGGMLLYGDARFCNMEFNFNNAYRHGGAVYSNNSESKFINCRFKSNVCNQYDGGAVNFNFSDIEMYNCVFHGNTANRYGGALTSVISEVKLQNCTFVGNSGPNNIFQQSVSGTLRIYNCVFDNNSAPTPISAGSSIDFTDGIVPNATWSFLCPTCLTGVPAFVNSSTGNFALSAGSLGIDETLTGVYVNPYSDIIGNTRLVGTSMDMGAYEFQGTTGIHENTKETSVQIFPNPGSENLTIMTDEKVVEVWIFDILGNLVTTETRNIFSVARLAPGVYILQIQTASTSDVIRFIKE